MEPAPGHLHGLDADEALLGRRVPGKQGQVESLEEILHQLELTGPTLDHHAPCLTGPGVVAIDLEGHGLTQDGPGQLAPSAVRNTTEA